MIPTFRPHLDGDELRAVGRVFDSRWLGMGDAVRAFEERLQEFLGVPHVVAVGHGTAALHLALDALDLQPGDEVLVPSLTFVATVQAIRLAGAIPVFCEVDPESLNLDVADALDRLSPRTRAVMPVHFAGLPCDMEPLVDAGRRHGFRIVEDAAHAFGAGLNGRKIGAWGDLTCFSFDSIKHITCGEGGAVSTKNADWAERLRQRRRLGMDPAAPGEGRVDAHWQYGVMGHGFRYHMSDINAAIGLVQLEKLPRFLQRKRQIVRRYDEELSGLPGLQFVRRNLEEACPWAYVLRILNGRREAFRDHLRNRGIATLVQFVPNHLQPAFAPWRTPLPVTERLFDEIVTLPLFTEMTDADVDQVLAAAKSFLDVPARVELACGAPTP